MDNFTLGHIVIESNFAFTQILLVTILKQQLLVLSQMRFWSFNQSSTFLMIKNLWKGLDTNFSEFSPH